VSGAEGVVTVDIMTALATAGQAIKLAQDLRGIDKAVDAAEYKIKIAALTEALADLKHALIDAKDDLATKDAEIDRLKKLLQRRAELVEHGGYSYDKGKDGTPKGLPYCPVCEQKDGLLFHLPLPPHGMSTSVCPNCKATYPRPYHFGDK
jgi:hypothetical protein